MKDIQFPVSYATLYRSTIHPTKPSKRTPIFRKLRHIFYVKNIPQHTARFAQHENRLNLSQQLNLYFCKYTDVFDSTAHLYKRPVTLNN